MASVYYANGRYFITNGVSSELQWALRAVKVEGEERDWVLSQSRGFVDCGGFATFEAGF